MNNGKFRQLMVVLATLATLFVNALANILPINGQNTGAISDRFEVYFVPAGYVFSIWGVIYLALIAYAIFQALPSQRDNIRLIKIAPFYLAGSLANIAWIFLWHYEVFPLTLVAMLVLLGSLVTTYILLDIGRAHVSKLEMWTVHLTFSIYLGWITVATIANVTDLLSYLKWDGFGIRPEIWAVIMLVVATVVTGAVAITRRDVGYMLVILWAFAGIAVKQSAVPLVATTAWVFSAVNLALLVIALTMKKRIKLQPSYQN